MKNNFGFILIIFYFALQSSIIHPQENINEKSSSINNRSFKELIGTWECKAISRSNDGSWKKDTVTATWIWTSILNDEAIQDVFYAGVSPGNIKSSTFSGINIRIYNPKEEKWNMAWFDTNNRKIATFTAVGKKDTILMEGINASGRPVKNIFSDITSSNFTWTQFWTFDNGKTWIDVSKIWCLKVK